MIAKQNFFIVHVSMGFGGGVGTVIKNLINYQINEGYKVGVSYLENEYNSLFLDEFEGKVEKLPIAENNKRLNQIVGLPLNELYRKIKLDYPKHKIILHAHNPVTVGLINNISELPLICTIHGVNDERSYLSKAITNKIVKKLKKNDKDIVGVSEQVSKYYNVRLNKDYITTILNGVNIKPVKNIFEFDKFTIGYLAYMDDLKGWRILFDAYNSLETYYKERINLVFAGQGTKDEIEKIKSLIYINKLKDKVKYLGFIKDAGNTITPNLDLIVLPSISEGLGMTIIEAIGNKVPILATKIGGIPEVLVDGENGFFIERNQKDIANKIKKVYNDKLLYKKMQDKSIEIYDKKFTATKMGDSYLHLYYSISGVD